MWREERGGEERDRRKGGREKKKGGEARKGGKVEGKQPPMKLRFVEFHCLGIIVIKQKEVKDLYTGEEEKKKI